MSRTRILSMAAFAALAASLLFPRPAFCAADPWYRDVRGHWAYDYVRVLWEEQVTDGYIPSVNPDVAYYWPDDNATRAELATMLCKVFQLPPRCPDLPSYPDVPRSYRLFWNKPAWQWIEGALQGGIIFVPAGDHFRPDSYITREDAVELLVRSLDLGRYSASLTESLVQSTLDRFYDSWAVSRDRRRSMACAVQMGIIKGYEDGSLRPRSSISRAEIATVVARSCLIRMTSETDSFSPDGDDIDETARFALTYLRNRGITSWQAVIEDSRGKTVCALGPPGATGPPPDSLAWQGIDSLGGPAAAGNYFYQALVTDRQNRQFMSVRRPLELERHALVAWLKPSVCRDGSVLTVTADTRPAAASVSVLLADGRTRFLTRLGQSAQWQIGVVVGSFLPAGAQSALVKAWFGDASREARLFFTRAEELWLEATIVPNPAAWGARVLLSCATPASVVAVEAGFLGSRVDLSRSGGGSWQSTVTVPWGLSPGFYPVQFTARTAASAAQSTVSLEVRAPDTDGLKYILSK